MIRFFKYGCRFCVCIVILFVGNVPKGMGQVTTPESFLGYSPGDDFKLAPYEQWVEYFELLSSQSEKLELFEMG